MRTPMNPIDAELIIGTRGTTAITTDNLPMVRRWLTAKGAWSVYANKLNKAWLANKIYNDLTDTELNRYIENSRANAEKHGKSGDAPITINVPDDAVPAPVVEPVIKTNGHDKNGLAKLREILLEGVEIPANIDESRVREIVAEALNGVAPHVIEVRQDDKPSVKIEGRVHPCFERVLRLLKRGLKVMLVGPAGCGKTTLAAQLAKALSCEYGMLSGSAGVSEGELKGWLLPVSGGAFEYSASQFVTGYEKGNFFFLFDEIDGFDNNILLSINCAIENGHFTVAIRRDAPSVKRGENVFILASANTFGTGANPLYCGRNPMDEATRDRFVIVNMDYDTVLERQIAEQGELTLDELEEIWTMRRLCREKELRRVISTRAIQKAAGMKQAGDSWNLIIDTLLAGWSRDERSKVGK